MKNKKLLILSYLLLILFWSCRQQVYEESNFTTQSKTSEKKVSMVLNQNQSVFLESRINETQKVMMEIVRLDNGNIKIIKTLSAISQDDPLDYYSFVFGSEILDYNDISLSLNLPEPKKFSRVGFEIEDNNIDNIPIGGYNYSCECCANPDDGGTINTGGLGMCLVVHGRHPSGALVINCYSKGCVTGCGLNSSPIGSGGTKRPSAELILDVPAASILIESIK
jgi:hypothetical protein